MTEFLFNITIYGLFILFSIFYWYVFKGTPIMLWIYVSLMPTFFLIVWLINHPFDSNIAFYDLSRVTIFLFASTLTFWAVYLLKKLDGKR